MIIRSSAFVEIGGFDERFFLYLEDADITRSLALTGRCIHYPFAFVTHSWGRGNYQYLSLMFVNVVSAWKYFFEVGICVVVVSYDVLLATYNGSLYLKEQLLSILAQTYPPHRIIISDDMSSDSTLDIVYSFINSTTKPIYLLPSPGVKLGCCKNFERLLAFSDSNYVMFSDQDDIWDLNKAEKLLNTMIYHESRHESSYPLLVHSDLRLIDSSGGFLQQSFLKYQSLNPAHNQWHQIAMQNIVSGCSCLVNRKCIDLALPFPPSVIMHDWWLALVASRMGKVIYLDTPTISYRQHY